MTADACLPVRAPDGRGKTPASMHQPQPAASHGGPDVVERGNREGNVAKAQTAARTARPKAGTRWKRFAMVAVPAFGVSGLILGLTAEGALAASFAVAGTNFRISADRLVGTGMVQYGTVDVGGNGAKHPVAVNGFKSVDIYSLCQSMVVPSPFGDMTIKLNAGSKTDPVKVTNMVTDLDLLEGNVTFNNPNI